MNKITEISRAVGQIYGPTTNQPDTVACVTARVRDNGLYSYLHLDLGQCAETDVTVHDIRDYTPLRIERPVRLADARMINRIQFRAVAPEIQEPLIRWATIGTVALMDQVAGVRFMAQTRPTIEQDVPLAGYTLTAMNLLDMESTVDAQQRLLGFYIPDRGMTGDPVAIAEDCLTTAYVALRTAALDVRGYQIGDHALASFPQPGSVQWRKLLG